MQTLKDYSKTTLVEYAKDSGPVNTTGWQWARRFTNNPKKFIRMAKSFASQTKLKSIK